MKTLGNLVVIFLVILGVLALVPLAAMGVGLVFGIFCLAIWLTPFWIIATSDKTTGFEKIAWLLANVRVDFGVLDPSAFTVLYNV